jgi:hypothetical protein
VTRAREAFRVKESEFPAPTASAADDEDDAKPAEGDEAKDENEKKEPPLVASGGIKAGDGLVGKPAILDVPTGMGRVIAFGFDPIHRYQTESDFRLVWNTILYWNDLPLHP